MGFRRDWPRTHSGRYFEIIQTKGRPDGLFYHAKTSQLQRGVVAGTSCLTLKTALELELSS